MLTSADAPWAQLLDGLRRGHLAKLALLTGLILPFTPIDLIPNRIPVIGYADQVAFVVLGIVAAWYLLPQRPAPAALSVSLRRVARRAVLEGTGWVLAAPALRLSIGRAPREDEVARFRAAFPRFAPLPPLLRGLAAVPAMRPLLTRAMLAEWLNATPEEQARLGGSGAGLRVWSGPPVAFLHLEKTAGMSLVSVLAAQFHPLQIDADPGRAFPPHVRCPFPTHALRAARRAALVHGHYDLPSIRRLGQPRFVFTVLREPRARILSLYAYWRGQAALDLGHAGMNQPVLAAQRMGLGEFLASEDPMVRNYIDNFYVRRLTGHYAWPGEDDPVQTEPEGALQAALAALETIDLVGLTEALDETLSRLGRALEFPPPARPPRENVTREAVPVVDDEAAARLGALTRLDAVVYKRAQERFVLF